MVNKDDLLVFHKLFKIANCKSSYKISLMKDLTFRKQPVHRNVKRRYTI